MSRVRDIEIKTSPTDQSDFKITLLKRSDIFGIKGFTKNKNALSKDFTPLMKFVKIGQKL